MVPQWTPTPGIAIARADFDGNDRHIARASAIAQDLTDARQQVRVDPIHHETVGGEQLERARALQHLQRAHPGIELLFGKLGLQRAHATNPKGRFHELEVSRDRLVLDREKGREVYTSRGRD